MYNGLVLKTFKSKKYAQKLCDYTNECYGDNYIVKEMIKWKTKKKIEKIYLVPREEGYGSAVYEIVEKVNEIIKWINDEDEEEN